MNHYQLRNQYKSKSKLQQPTYRFSSSSDLTQPPHMSHIVVIIVIKTYRLCAVAKPTCNHVFKRRLGLKSFHKQVDISGKEYDIDVARCFKLVQVKINKTF